MVGILNTILDKMFFFFRSNFHKFTFSPVFLSKIVKVIFGISLSVDATASTFCKVSNELENKLGNRYRTWLDSFFY